jgi:hypothetical protein
MGWLTLRGRASDAAETLLRSAYSYRDGGTAPFPRSGVGRAGKAQVRRWRTSATRSVSIRPRPISLRSRFPSCARTVLGAPTACAASSSHSRLPFPQRVRVESKGRAMLLPSMRRVTSCRRSPTPSDEPRRGVTSRDSLWIAQPFCSSRDGHCLTGCAIGEVLGMVICAISAHACRRPHVRSLPLSSSAAALRPTES